MGLAWADGRRTRPAKDVENWGVGLVPPPLQIQDLMHSTCLTIVLIQEAVYNLSIDAKTGDHEGP